MTLIRFARTTVLLTVGAAACSSSGKSVRPDDMSAEAHRQEAARAMQEANVETKAVSAPPNLTLSPNGNPEGYYAPVNPSGQNSDARAQRLQRHAQQHLTAAATLESFEDSECKSIPPASRAACPLLGPAVAVEMVNRGVRVRFSETANVPRIVTQMRCHLAYARTRGFDRVTTCALYLRGVEVVAGTDGRTVDLLGHDPTVVAAIQERTSDEVILTSGDGR
jgi:hypothetical protein